jgi:HlyD family secretion protein
MSADGSIPIDAPLEPPAGPAAPVEAAPEKPAIDTTDDPRKEIRTGGLIAFAFFGLFLGWAAFAPLDAGAIGQGVVAVSGNRQAVQHREGGTVAALYVREGDVVKKGQVLLEIGSGDLRAEERALAGRVISLKAARARLAAERDGLAAVPVPADFATLSPEDQVLAGEAMRLETLQLNARRDALRTQEGVLTQRVGQLNQQIVGYSRQSEANQEQQRLLNEELEGTKSLAAKGYAPQTRVRALERTLADLKGSEGSYAADVARSRDAIGEARLQLMATRKQHVEEVVEQLRRTELDLAESEPRWIAAKDRLARAQVRAPATGAVVGLKIHTVGGVVGAGETLMEVVPQDASLVLDVMVSPQDADDLRIGQETQVRFPSFHERDLPVLKGRLTKLSADSFVDEKTGGRFFKAEVAVPPAEVAVIRRVRGAQPGLKPGLPVEVVVPLRKRTALAYLTEPLAQGFWKSFRES